MRSLSADVAGADKISIAVISRTTICTALRKLSFPVEVCLICHSWARELLEDVRSAWVSRVKSRACQITGDLFCQCATADHDFLNRTRFNSSSRSKCSSGCPHPFPLPHGGRGKFSDRIKQLELLERLEPLEHFLLLLRHTPLQPLVESPVPGFLVVRQFI